MGRRARRGGSAEPRAGRLTQHFAIVGGYAHEEPTGNASLNGTDADFDGSGAPTLGASYYINDNIAIEGWGAADKFSHRVRTGADGKVATVEAQPYALSGQYHFRDAGSTVRPFVGLGYFESNISRRPTPAPTPGSASA